MNDPIALSAETIFDGITVSTAVMGECPTCGRQAKFYPLLTECLRIWSDSEAAHVYACSTGPAVTWFLPLDVHDAMRAGFHGAHDFEAAERLHAWFNQHGGIL